jgi:hypothetical protein
MDLTRIIPVFAAVAALSLSGAIHADATLQYTDSGEEGSGSTLMIKGSQVRMEEREADGSTVYSLFDSETRTFVMVIDEERGYAELTEDGLRAQAGEVRAMQEQFLQQMRQQMEQMPPEQRSMMEQQMLQMGIDAAMLSGEDSPVPDSSALETRRTGGSSTIGGVRCEGMEVLLDGTRTNELCVADPEKLGLSAADFATLRILFEFMQSLSDIALSMGGPFAAEMSAEMLPVVDGVPVQVKNLQDGSVITLESVSTDALSADLFQVPAGYQRVDPF